MIDRFSRSQVLAYRATAQGLHRDRESVQPHELDVVDLGVQDTPVGSAATAFAVRGVVLPDDPGSVGLATTWTTRGAPHVHRRDELVWWSRALWPWSDEDAVARLDTSASNVRASDLSPRGALRFVAEQLIDIVDRPMPKGEVSTALTPRLPGELTVDCRRCEATHVVETLWRGSVLPAGFTFDPSSRTVTFVPDPHWPGVPDDTADAPTLASIYLRLLGPAGPEDVGAYLGTRTDEVVAHWPADLAEVEVDGVRRWVPEDARQPLREAPPPPRLRLVPPSDPWLQARDRDLLVPDAAARKRLWPILGRPGAVLVDGEVAGVWRARKKGRRLEVRVEPFGQLPSVATDHLDDEGQRVALSRGATEALLVLEAA